VHTAAISACVTLQTREKPDGVDGMEMNSAMTSYTDDSMADVSDTWMTSLPEVSSVTMSPTSSPVPLTFGPHSGKQAAAALSNENLNDNDLPPPPPDADVTQ